MKSVFLPDGASPRQAINSAKPGEVFLMYADSARIRLVAQVCRDQQQYYVVGPRYNQHDPKGPTIDQIVEADLVDMHNLTLADDRCHIYRCPDAAAAMEKLQYLFKANKLPG